MALRESLLSEKTRLYIFCDGHREGQQQNAEAVRKVVNAFSWPGEKTIIERSENLGLAESIKRGISQVLTEHERVIVLEDDVVVSRGFLEYMNAGLSLYSNEASVTAICGFIPEAPLNWILSETFFLRHFECWGWATWRRVWSGIDWDAQSLWNRLSESRAEIHLFDFDHHSDYVNHLKANIDGRMQTWAILFQASAFLMGGHSLFPRRSLVRNIGCDSSGVHCTSGESEFYSVTLVNAISVTKRKPVESKAGRYYFKRFHEFGKESLLKQAIQTARRCVRSALRQCLSCMGFKKH